MARNGLYIVVDNIHYLIKESAFIEEIKINSFASLLTLIMDCDPEEMPIENGICLFNAIIHLKTITNKPVPFMILMFINKILDKILMGYNSNTSIDNNKYVKWIKARTWDQSSDRDHIWTNVIRDTDSLEPYQFTEPILIDFAADESDRTPILDLPELEVKELIVEVKSHSTNYVEHQRQFTNYSHELEFIRKLIILNPNNLCNKILKYIINCEICDIIKNAEFWNIVQVLTDRERNKIIQYTFAILNNLYWNARFRKIIDVNQRFVFNHDQCLQISKNITQINSFLPPVISITNKYLINGTPLKLISYRKLTDKETFNKRMSVVYGNLFKVKLSQYNACICGSSLIPCVAYNPLEESFDSFEEYINYFYRGNTKKYNIPSLNINDDDYKDVKDQDINMDKETEYQLKTIEIDNTVQLMNIDFIDINMLNQCDQIKKIRHLYHATKTISNAYSDIDIHIYAKPIQTFKTCVYGLFEDLSQYDPNIQLTKVVYRTTKISKYLIHGGSLTRDIEVFCGITSHINLINKFHLSVVRMYYADELIVTITALIALLSGINHDCSWYKCGKSPGDAILKYAKRGYTTLINSIELDMLNRYNDQLNPKQKKDNKPPAPSDEKYQTIYKELTEEFKEIQLKFNSQPKIIDNNIDDLSKISYSKYMSDERFNNLRSIECSIIPFDNVENNDIVQL
jgi:hypothetical protein